MTEAEIAKLKADITADVLKEITGNDYNPPNSDTTPWGMMREKYKDRLHVKYGNYHYDQVWQLTRRLACYAAGVRYVRDLKPSLMPKAVETVQRILEIMLEGDDDSPQGGEK